MKKLFLSALMLATCFAAFSATADEAPTPEAALQVEAATVEAEATPAEEAEAKCPAAAVSPLQLESPLDVPVQNVCACLDLCKKDRQCGPGGVCLPTGPCGCKQCFAAS